MSEPYALIIEDEADLAEIFSEALLAAGYRTEIIRAGDLAQQRLAQVTPDVVVLDLHLPRVDGRALLHQIRTDPRLKNTRVMIASADPRMADELDGAADLVLLKPIGFGQLRDLAKRLMRTLPSAPATGPET